MYVKSTLNNDVRYLVVRFMIYMISSLDPYSKYWKTMSFQIVLDMRSCFHSNVVFTNPRTNLKLMHISIYWTDTRVHVLKENEHTSQRTIPSLPMRFFVVQFCQRCQAKASAKRAHTRGPLQTTHIHKTCQCVTAETEVLILSVELMFLWCGLVFLVFVLAFLGGIEFALFGWCFASLCSFCPPAKHWYYLLIGILPQHCCQGCFKTSRDMTLTLNHTYPQNQRIVADVLTCLLSWCLLSWCLSLSPRCY